LKCFCGGDKENHWVVKHPVIFVVADAKLHSYLSNLIDAGQAGANGVKRLVKSGEGLASWKYGSIPPE
jgi:hypothetical protein